MDRIGRYEVLAELGRGSMGAVYRARDPQIGRVVAIKIILTANLSAEDLELYKQRFVREAQAAGQMQHPGIVTIHDIAEDATGQPYLVMEFIEGTPLDKLLQPGGERLSLSQCLDIGIQVAEALDYAHRRGVVHRDVKPANILLTAEGRAKIADFGIAKLAGVQMTQAGHMVGTPAFMSPEQFSGGTVDARTDLFSLGAMLYWMFTGERPFAGDTLTTVSFKVVYTAPIPAKQLNPSLPPEVDTILSRCLAKNPDERYPSCRELCEDLRALKEGRMVRTQPVPVPAMDQTVTTVAPLGSGTIPGSAPASPVVDATRRGPPIAGVIEEIEATPVGFWTRGRKIGAAAVLLLLLLTAGYAFWPAPQEPPVATEPEAAPPPAPRRSTPASRPAGKPAAQPTAQPPAQPAQKEPTVEDILREKGEEYLRDQLKKKTKGKGRR
jgi:serine/threonine-protein kinase